MGSARVGSNPARRDLFAGIFRCRGYTARLTVSILQCTGCQVLDVPIVFGETCR
jgi:hypothetical protein